MDLKYFVATCLVLGLCLSGSVSSDEDSLTWNKQKYMEEAGQIFDLFFHTYNDAVRPPLQYMEVKVNVTLNHLRFLDVMKQELQTILDLKVSWVDGRLQWYPKRIFQVALNTSRIWIPDIIFTNTVSRPVSLYPQQVVVSSRGEIEWTRREVVTTYCPTVLDRAQQFCSLSMEFHSGMEDRLFSNESYFQLDKNFRNNEWRLLMGQMEISGEDNSTDATKMVIDMELERRGRGGGGGSGNQEGNTYTTEYAASGSNEDTGSCCNSRSVKNGNSGPRDLADVIVHILTVTALVVTTPVLSGAQLGR